MKLIEGDNACAQQQYYSCLSVSTAPNLSTRKGGVKLNALEPGPCILQLRTTTESCTSSTRNLSIISDPFHQLAIFFFQKKKLLLRFQHAKPCQHKRHATITQLEKQNTKQFSEKSKAVQKLLHERKQKKILIN